MIIIILIALLALYLLLILMIFSYYIDFILISYRRYKRIGGKLSTVFFIMTLKIAITISALAVLVIWQNQSHSSIQKN